MEKILTALGYRIDKQHDAMKKSPKDWGKPVALGTALADFQRQHPGIPRVEFGTRIGAITQWYLRQAGFAVSRKTGYPASPGGELLPVEDAPVPEGPGEAVE